MTPPKVASATAPATCTSPSKSARPRLRVLVACECSGRVRDAFTALGHDAWSCDLKPSETPGQHVQGDVRGILNDGWDLMVAHPDCTYLTIAAEWAYGDGPYHQKVQPVTLVGAARRAARDEAVAFFELLWSSKIPRVAIENPVGCIPRLTGRPATQKIQPHQFGDDASKGTCLWLRNLPPLVATKHVAPRMVGGLPRWGNQTDSGQNKIGPRAGRATERSRTYAGIAAAIAEQWGGRALPAVVVLAGTGGAA